MCKGAAVVAYAWKLLETINFDWLINIYEDQYIQRSLFEGLFQRFDPSVPQVMGHLGCGRAWEYSPQSQGGTIPRPKNYIDPRKNGPGCEAVFQNGCICGGT